MNIRLERGHRYVIELHEHEDTIEVKQDSTGKLRRRTIPAEGWKTAVVVRQWDPRAAGASTSHAEGRLPEGTAGYRHDVKVTVLAEVEVPSGDGA